MTIVGICVAHCGLAQACCRFRSSRGLTRAAAILSLATPTHWSGCRSVHFISLSFSLSHRSSLQFVAIAFGAVWGIGIPVFFVRTIARSYRKFDALYMQARADEIARLRAKTDLPFENTISHKEKVRSPHTDRQRESDN
jgi:hypothetical protein